MANSKISALSTLSASSVDGAVDVIPIVDTSASTTKKILVDDLRTALGIATQAQQETGTSNVVFVTPGRQQYHQSAAKAWCEGSFAGTASASYNVASVTDGGTGIATVNFTTSFSSANFCAVVSTQSTTGITVSRITSKTAGAVRCDFHNLAGALVDVDAFNVACFGDQA